MFASAYTSNGNCSLHCFCFHHIDILFIGVICGRITAASAIAPMCSHGTASILSAPQVHCPKNNQLTGLLGSFTICSCLPATFGWNTLNCQWSSLSCKWKWKRLGLRLVNVASYLSFPQGVRIELPPQASYFILLNRVHSSLSNKMVALIRSTAVCSLMLLLALFTNSTAPDNERWYM